MLSLSSGTTNDGQQIAEHQRGTGRQEAEHADAVDGVGAAGVGDEAEQQGHATGDRGHGHEPVEPDPDHVQGGDLVDGQGDRGEQRRPFVADDRDELRPGDLHRLVAPADEPGVRVGDHGLEGGPDLRIVRLQVGLDLGPELERRDADGGGGGVGADPRDLGADRAVVHRRVDDVGAHVVGEGDALQPPSAGGEGQADGGDEEEQGGEAATHRTIVADAWLTLRAWLARHS